jgi:hypothetical protein
VLDPRCCFLATEKHGKHEKAISCSKQRVLKMCFAGQRLRVTSIDLDRNQWPQFNTA